MNHWRPDYHGAPTPLVHDGKRRRICCECKQDIGAGDTYVRTERGRHQWGPPLPAAIRCQPCASLAARIESGLVRDHYDRPLYVDRGDLAAELREGDSWLLASQADFARLRVPPVREPLYQKAPLPWCDPVEKPNPMLFATAVSLSLREINRWLSRRRDYFAGVVCEPFSAPRVAAGFKPSLAWYSATRDAFGAIYRAILRLCEPASDKHLPRTFEEALRAGGRDVIASWLPFTSINARHPYPLARVIAGGMATLLHTEEDGRRGAPADERRWWRLVTRYIMDAAHSGICVASRDPRWPNLAHVPHCAIATKREFCEAATPMDELELLDWQMPNEVTRGGNSIRCGPTPTEGWVLAKANSRRAVVIGRSGRFIARTHAHTRGPFDMRAAAADALYGALLEDMPSLLLRPELDPSPDYLDDLPF